MTHPRYRGSHAGRVVTGLLFVLLALQSRGAWAQQAELRAGSGGVVGRLVVLPTRGSGLYSWALPVTLGGLLKQAQVDTVSTEALAALLKERKLGDLAGGLPANWSPETLAAAAEAGQVGKDSGYVLMASWNTAQPDEKQWTDDTPFWLLATLKKGDTTVFGTTRLPREEGKSYLLADYQVAIGDLAEMVAQNISPAALEQARRADRWRQQITPAQVRLLAEAEQDIAAGRLQEARTRLEQAQAGATGAAGALVAMRRLVEVNAALGRQEPGRADAIGKQEEQAGRALAAQSGRARAWAELSVAEGLRLQRKWPDAAEAYLAWIQHLVDEQLMQPDEFLPDTARPELEARRPRLWGHLTTPGLEAQWWATVGVALYRGVSGAVAEPVCAYAAQRAAAESDPAARAAALIVLADQAKLRSDLQAALAGYQQALAIREQMSPGSLDCAAVHNKLGNAYADMDDQGRALEWYRKAVAIRERLAPDTLDCAVSYNNLGTVHTSRGDLDQALQWYEQALAIRERLAPGSLGCASTYNNIGAAYRSQGDGERALARFQQALAIYEREAPGSRDCAVIYNNLGNVACDQGEMDQALAWYEKALAIRERLTPDSLACAAVYNNIGTAYANHGEYDRALQWHQKARPLLERRAPGSSLCAMSYANIGQVYGHQGDFAAAVEWLQQALSIYQRLTPRSLDCACTDSAVGFYLLSLDRTEEALTHLTRAAAISPQDVGVQVNLAWGRLTLKQLDQAVAVLDRVCARPARDLAGTVTTKDESLAKHLLGQGNPGGYYLLGRVWEAANQVEWAVDAYGRFVESARGDRTWRLLDEQLRSKRLGADK